MGHKLQELKEMLCRELEEYGERDNLDVGGLDVVDKLAHAIKNIDKIIEAEEEYSGRSYRGRSGRSYDGGYYGGGSYEGGYDSYEYGGRSMRGRGRNAKRDSMGRYSRDGGDMAGELRRLMNDTGDEQTRAEIERMLQRYE